MGKISNLSSYGFNEQPQFDGFINSLKEKADTTEIAEQVKKQESDIKNINDINTKQDEQILGLNVDIKQSGNAFTFTQGGKNLAVINQENGEGSSVIGGSFSNGKLTLNNSNNTSVEIDASSLAFKGDATSIPNLDAYATKQWVEDKKYLTQHQSLDDYAKTSEVSGELAKKSNVGHTHQISDITDLLTQFDGYATEEWVNSKGYLTQHQDLSTYAKKEDIPSLEGYATEEWVNSKNYLTSHQSLEDYATKEQLSTKADKEHTHLLKDITDYVAPNLSIYAKKTDIPSLNGYATEQWVTEKNYLTTHQSLEDYAKKTDIPNMDGYATKTELSTKQDKGDYALKSDIKPIPSVLSAFNNDVGYLTTHQDLTPYAKKTDIPSLEGYATKQWVTDKNYLTQHQSLEDYYTKSEVDNKFKDFSGVTSTDLTKYYTKVESDGKYATKEEIPSLDGYATEQWVTNKGYLTSHQDLTDYARKAEIKTVNGHSLIGSGDIQIEVGSSVDLSNYYTKTDSDGKYALKRDIPSLNGYATEQWVTNKGYLTQHQSLEDYYTKTESDGKYALKTSIPSLNGYATEQWVTNKGYLTQHQSLEEYYTKTESDGKYALKTEIQELPKFKTVNGQAITGSTDDITINPDLSNYYKKSDTSGATEIRDALAKKQDYNENYVTSNQLADYATTSYVNGELAMKADATDIPTNKIELTFTLTDGSQITKKFYCE